LRLHPDSSKTEALPNVSAAEIHTIFYTHRIKVVPKLQPELLAMPIKTRMAIFTNFAILHSDAFLMGAMMPG
jgi:hypothetical protein